MKCPKCGYVGFEYLDQCKKCGNGLESFKSEHGLYGYQPNDLMVVEYLEEKARVEKEVVAAKAEKEEDVVTVLEEEDGSLENIVSEIKGVAQDSESAEESTMGISLDLEDVDTAGDEAEKIAADLGKVEEPPAKKESSEIDLSIDEIELGETETLATTTAPAEKKDLEDDVILELGDVDADLEIDEEITGKEPKSEKKDDEKKEDDKDSDDEIKLELE